MSRYDEALAEFSRLATERSDLKEQVAELNRADTALADRQGELAKQAATSLHGFEFGVDVVEVKVNQSSWHNQNRVVTYTGVPVGAIFQFERGANEPRLIVVMKRVVKLTSKTWQFERKREAGCTHEFMGRFESGRHRFDPDAAEWRVVGRVVERVTSDNTATSARSA